MGKQVLVAVSGGIVAHKFARPPPIRSAYRVDTLFEAVFPSSSCLSANADAFYFIGRKAWNIDVESREVG